MEQPRGNAKEILERYANGVATEEEKRWVESWYEQQDTVPFSLNEALAEADLAAVHHRLVQNLRKRKLHRLRRTASIAASVVLPIIAAGYVIWSIQTQGGPEQVTSPILPGTNRATLTLTDGRTIALDETQAGIIVNDKNILYEDHSSVAMLSKVDAAATTEMLTLATPRGGQYRITLPDGSIAWLNAASTLRYPAIFDVDRREVEITGEVYFEISPDKKHPFVVSHPLQTVEVLGTKFNVNAYSDENSVRTTLVEGSVLVRPQQGRHIHSVTLAPGEAALLGQDDITVIPVDAMETVAWKDGKFMFNDSDIRSIMRRISRWYDVDVQYTGDVTGITFTGSVSRFDDIHDVLRKIELTESVRFKTEGRRIMVSR
ncbi:FecR family protein [Parapedobacter sp. 2B3]|uniref:FecR family protein n=1 Tax=Parapedobacter sp. 2B3 TaxID=3342381 RepID=UPI0035B6473C